MAKKITLITAVYNRADLVEETINSILNQNYPNLEYIVIDDHSTDNTEEVVRKYEKHLTFYKNEVNMGLYKTLNKGYAKSTGEIMGWLNSDDLLHPGCLSIVNDIFTEYEEIKWLTGTQNTRDIQSRISNVAKPKIVCKDSFYFGKLFSIQQESTFWRRELWEKAGSKVSEEYPTAADHELWMKFFLYADIYSVSALLGSFRNHGKQMSLERRVEYLSEIKKMRAEYKQGREKEWLTYKIKELLYNIMPNRLAQSRRVEKLLFDNKNVAYNFGKNKFEII